MLSGGTSRQAIAKAITKLFSDNIPEAYGNVKPYLRFWDEIEDFPYISVTCTNETRDYLPGSFEWGFVTTNIRCYVKSDTEEPAEDLEKILVKIEKLLRSNSSTLPIGTTCTTTDIRVVSIDVDGGLLKPLGVGEITAVVQYQVN